MSSAGTSITSSDGGLTNDAGLAAPGCAGDVREAVDAPAECVLGALPAAVALGGGLAAFKPGTGRATPAPPASPAPRNAVTVGGRTHSVT